MQKLEARENVRERVTQFLFYFWLAEKVARVF